MSTSTPAPVPHVEPPIYVEYFARGDHHDYDESDTSAAERRPIDPRECWLDMPSIPAIPPLVATPIVAPTTTPLVAVPGNASRFASPAFRDMIPANYGNGAYKPTLVDAGGAPIPYDPSVWVADGVRGVVEFKYKTLAQLGYQAPPTISYWRYTGAFPGPGAAGVTNGFNDGAPAPGQVFSSLIGTTLHFRTLRAGPGVTLVQDVAPSAAGEILISATNAVVPTDILLYVDDTGNDATGDGSFATPYATLQRAFSDIEKTGWDNTAIVRVKANATLTPLMSLNAGGRGRQTAPVHVQGSPQAVARSGAVTSVANDIASLLLVIEDTSGAFTPADIGRVMRFTSGPLATFVPTASPILSIPFPPPFQFSAYISQVLDVNTVLITASGVPAPNVGDTYDLLDNTSQLIVTSALPLAVFTSDSPIVFRDLDVSATGTPGAFVGVIAAGFDSDFVGVRFLCGPNIAVVLANVGGTLRTGYMQINEAVLPITPSVLGIAVYEPVPSSFSLFIHPNIDGSSATLTNSMFRMGLTAGGGGVSLQGNIAMASCDCFGGVILQSGSGGSSTNFCRFDGLGVVSAGVLAEGSGSVVVAGTHFLGSVVGGAFAHNGGTITIEGGNNLFDSCENGVYARDGGLIVFSIFSSAAIAGTAPFSQRAMLAERGGKITINVSPTVTGTFQDAVAAADSAEFYFGQNITLAGAQGAALRLLNGSKASCTNFFGGTVLTLTSTAWYALELQTGSEMTAGTVDVVSSFNGIAAAGGSKLTVYQNVNANGTTQGTGGPDVGAGLTINANSHVNVIGTLTVSGNAGHGVWGNGFFSDSRATLAAGAITAGGNARYGLWMDNCDLLVGGLLDTTTNSTGNVFLNYGSARLKTVVATSSASSANINLVRQKWVSGSVDASGNSVGDGIVVDVGSDFVATAIVDVHGCIGRGFSVSNGSRASMTVGDNLVLLAEDCALGVDVTGVSTLECGGDIRAAHTSLGTTGNGVSVVESTLRAAGTITVDAASGTGMFADRSTIVARGLNAFTCSLAGSNPSAGFYDSTVTIETLGLSSSAALVTQQIGVLDLKRSTLTVNNSVTSATGTMSGLRAESSSVLIAHQLDVSVPGVGVASNTISCVTLLQSTLVVGSTAAGDGMTASGAGGGGGGGLAAAGAGLYMQASKATLIGALLFTVPAGTVGVNAAGQHVRAFDGSEVQLEGGLTGGGAPTSLFSGPVVGSSVSTQGNSRAIVRNIPTTGAAPAVSHILVAAASTALIVGGSISASAGASNGVRVTQDSNAFISGINIASCTGDAILVDNGSNATLSGVVGSLNTGYGVRILKNSKVTATVTTLVTGALGDVLVGANAVTTWAIIVIGASAFVSDFAALTPQLCTCVSF